MIKTVSDSGAWSLFIDDAVFIRRTEECPFVTAFRHEKVYSFNHGTVKVQTEEAQ